MGASVKQSHYSRREFLGMSAAAAGASLAAKTIVPLPRDLIPAAAAVPASDRVRFGMIGVGMQGSGLLSEAITLPGVAARPPPLSGAPRRQEHRLHRGGGSGSLAQAGGRRCGERGQGHLLREA